MLEELLGRIFPVELSVVAFDPGETTGVVAVSKAGVVQSYHLTERELAIFLSEEKSVVECDAWVHEKFLLYPWKTEQQGFSDMVAARMIGMIQLAAFKGKMPLYSYTAQQSKNLVKDHWFDIIGWKIKNRHERDAARQAVLHQIKYHQGDLPKPLQW